MSLLSLIIQLLGGAAGGNIVGSLLKNANLTSILKTVLGIIGGVGGGQLAALLPMLQGILGPQASTPSQLIGNVGTSAIGGAVLTAIVGMIKQSMDQSK